MHFSTSWPAMLSSLTLAGELGELLAKSTLWLSLAAGLAWALRRQSAALRHLVWSLALAWLVVLPALSIALPRWRVLPQWLELALPASSAPVEALPEAPRGTRRAAPGDAVAGDSTQNALPDNALAAADRENGAASGAPEVLPQFGDSRAAVQSPGADASGVGAAAGPLASNSRWQWLAVLWAAGTTVLAARLACSRWRLGRLCAHGKLVQSGSLHAEHVRAAQALALGRPVALVLADSGVMPLAFGVWRARVVLPVAAQAWEPAQRRTVLLHELGHVARHDPLWQLLAQLAVALYWPNPLVWLAAWRVHLERERACDDLVLERDVAPQDYARHLLDVVSGGRLRRLYAALGVAMAASRSLEARLRSILTPVRSRRPATRSALCAGLTTALLAGVPLAMLQGQEPPTQSGKPGATSADAVEQPAADSNDGAEVPFGPLNPGLTPDHHTVAVRYDESLLVVWNRTGALAIAFEQPPDAPGEVRYAYRWTDGLGEEVAGSGKLSTTAEEPQPFGVGELQLVATFLNSSLGHFDYNPDEVAVTPLKRDWFLGEPAPAPGLSATQPVALSRFLHPDQQAARLYREQEYHGANSLPPSVVGDVASFVRYGANGLVVSTSDGTAVFVFDGAFDRAQEKEHNYGVRYRWRFVRADGLASNKGQGVVQEVYVDGEYSSARTTHYLEAGPIHLPWSQGGPEGGWVYHNPAWHAVWFVDRGRGQELLQPLAPAPQLLRFAYGRHQPRDARETAAETPLDDAAPPDAAPADEPLNDGPTTEPPTTEPPTTETPAATGATVPARPFRTEEFARVVQEQDDWMRLVPQTAADRQWIEAVLSWGNNDYDGWRVGALLVNDLDTVQPLQAGDPAAVRYFFQNVTDAPRTVRVQPVDWTYPVLGEGGQLNLNLMHRGENIEFTAAPGEAVSPAGFAIPVETTGLPEGEYRVYTVSAFSVPNEDGSGGGSYWRVGKVALTIGQGGPFSTESSTDAEGVAWGGSVAGLRVGMRMSNGRPQQALGALLQGEMFVWNTTDRPLVFEWDPPAPLDQNQVVSDEQGEYVNLNRVFYTGIRPQNPQSFTLQPGEKLQVGRSLLQSAAEATQPGPSDPAQLVATTGKFTWQAYLSLNLKDLPQFTLIAGSGPVPIEIVGE